MNRVNILSTYSRGLDLPVSPLLISFRGCVKLELEATSTRVSLVGRDPHPTNRQDFWRREWRDFDQQQAERCAGGTGRGC